jgi:rhamnogalacturonyl hydrolase YesR
MTPRLPIQILHATLAMVAFIVTPSGCAADAPRIPTRAETLAVMERAADWQLAHPFTKFPPTDWINAAFYTGLMALSEISPSPRFHDAMLKIGEGNAWKLGPLPFHADDHCVGQSYAELYLRDKQPQMIAGMQQGFDFVIANPRDNNFDFDKEKNPTRLERWSWCDALFMAPPAYLRLSAATGDARYREFAVEKWWATSDFLYDKDEHLFYRDSTFFGKREANGKKVFWSRGNGWVLAGLARMLDFLPADHPARARFEQQFREMSEKILPLQQPDGFWRVSLLDPASFPWQESSGTGFYCYALAWGANHGLIDREKGTTAALRAWNALTGCLTSDGKLTHVQIVAGSPKSFPADSTMPYGVGAFLLAGREIYRLGR